MVQRGLFGIEGEHFDMIWAAQELVEVVLQTIQAQRLSRWAARPWLNRGYAAMTICNCWLTSLVHHYFAHNIPLKRIVTLFLDCYLDFVSAVVVPFVIAFPYIEIYDPSTSGLLDFGWR
ncbi:TPA: hypothetical protein N0F65_000670 [Lagenidium giganteum]|uniref:Uncharacterized protein n=1 Tax=Lagenidium giganteum TaxID=4803 RepID=A0AAV2YNA4_9STRA|nr:TPA: hypothetical protein N0F65_000670 [Lagenidium giganteum]